MFIIVKKLKCIVLLDQLYVLVVIFFLWTMKIFEKPFICNKNSDLWKKRKTLQTWQTRTKNIYFI